ncbi:hypothetical protein UUU_43520 [Klebsiella pneumoniae subsp. pneumoniae DSM 30104 = JCM 1662 = NBRC 14940]|nr:hypothetical protein UUU_43520 [Klebsiella pneumoniae subsp. pneumoniae DSM 30104 = JCM 1662 = NBRC 14940]
MPTTPTARQTKTIAFIVSPLRLERVCFISLSHIERISIIMNT